MSTFGPDSVLVRGPNVVSTIWNPEYARHICLLSSCMTCSLCRCTPATYIAFYTSAKFKTVFLPYVLPAINSFTLNGALIRAALDANEGAASRGFCFVFCFFGGTLTMITPHCTATYADLPDLMYPSIANKNGQWVPNQECLKKCGLQMPTSVQASG